MERTNWKALATGSALALVAFVVTLSLEQSVGETYFALFIGATALGCWRAGWRAGVAATMVGLVCVALLLPPLFTLTVDSRSDIVRLSLFCVISGVVCAITAISDRRAARLASAEMRSELSEAWIRSAQKELLLWTWELDFDRDLLTWRNPYAEVACQEFRSFEIWIRSIVPEDRDAFKAAMRQAIVSGAVHVQYRANTSRGLHRLVSRGVLVHHPDPGSRRLVGITLDLDAKSVSAVPSLAQQRQETSRWVLALIGLNDLLNSIEQKDALDLESRAHLARAREEISRILITDIAS